jgi:hypothetical protein
MAVWSSGPGWEWSESTNGGVWSAEAPATGDEFWASTRGLPNLAASDAGWVFAAYGATAAPGAKYADPMDVHIYSMPFGASGWSSSGLTAVVDASTKDDQVSGLPGGLACQPGQGCALVWDRDAADGVDKDGFPKVKAYVIAARVLSPTGLWSAAVDLGREPASAAGVLGSVVDDGTTWVAGWSPLEGGGYSSPVWSRRLSRSGTASALTQWSATGDGRGVSVWTDPSGHGHMAWAEGESVRVATLS